MKTSVILTQTSQLKDSIDSALIEADSENVSDLITAAQKAEVTINALTNTTDLTGKQLTGDGFPEGCFVVFDLRQLTIKIDDFLIQLSGLFQDGYQIGIINDLSKYSDDEIKKLQLYEVYLINSGQENTNQDATISGNKISDINEKLAKNRSLVDFRGFTNVPSPTSGARVGIGKDTSGLQGGPAIGYSTNGRDFYAAITPYGFTFRKRDAENMWRLLRPKQRDDIDQMVGDSVAKEVDSATAEIPAIESAANEGVRKAENAIASSKVNSDALVAQSNAISEAKSSMESSIAEINQAIADASSNAAKIRADVDQVQSEVNSAKSANESTVAQIKSDISQTKDSLTAVNEKLTQAQSAANQAQSALREQVNQLSASVTANQSAITQAQTANDNVAKRLDVYASQASAQGETIKSVQSDVAGNTSIIADINSNVTQVQQTADNLSVSLKNADSSIASVKAQADNLSATLSNQAKSIATVTQVQQITASIDGIQSAVRNKADSSTVTQLSNLVQSKVSSDSFNSSITQLNNAISARVSKGNLLSEINLQADGTLIKGKKIFLDGQSVVFADKAKAFIPDAAITNVTADKITTGTLNGVEIRQLETGGRSIDIKNGNIAIASNDPYESRISFTNNGKDAKMFNAVGDIEVLNQEFALFNFTPEDTHSLNPISFFRVVNTGNTGSGSAHLYMDHAIIDGNEWWTPAGGITFGRTWDGTNASSDYVDLYAKSFVPHSELSAKTRIKKLDRKEALDKIMQDDMYTYQFKEDVRDGVSKRYASFIIDNIHDVAQYTEPEEFLSANGKGRDDGTQLAYLIAAVQYQQEQIEELKKKLEEK